ncbi:MAG: TonB-dependent receptor [Bacteroidota bacterium]
MRATSVRVFLFLFCSISFTIAWGQDDMNISYKETPLKNVLSGLEQKTGLLFSYSDEVVAAKTVTLSAKSIEISLLLRLLQENTGLMFERVGENQVIISVPSNKTSVCGYLFDALSKTPLPYATILVNHSSNGYTTDENGYFSIEYENLQQGVLFQYVGYATQLLASTDFGKTNCRNILLYPKAESLKEVVVKSYLIKGIDKNKDGSLSIKSSEQDALPGLVEPDIFQSIQWVPGVTSINETLSDIQIRGGSPDQNLILFDNIKIYNAGHFFGMVSIFNPNITAGATVFKGGASPEYGNRISGVIDIQGEHQVPEKTAIGIGLNGTQVDAFVKARLNDKVGLVVSGRRSYTDVFGFETPIFSAISEKVFQNTVIVDNGSSPIVDVEEEEASLLEGNETFYFYDANAKLILKPSDKDSIYLSALLTNNDLNFRLLDEENISQDILTTENQGISFKWSGIRAGRWKHSLSGYYSNYETGYRNVFREEQEVQEENLRRNAVEDYGLDLRMGYDLNETHEFTLGYQTSTNTVFYQLFRDQSGIEDIEPEDEDPEGVDSSQDNRDFNEISTRSNTSNAFYGDYSLRTKNRGLIRLGIRASNFSILEDWFWEPRLNVEYPLANFFRLKFTGEKRYQAISQLVEFEDTQSRLESGIWTLTDNEDFPLLESQQFSGGVLIDFSGWTFDLDAYVKKIDGLTSFTNGFTSASEDYSRGSSDILGLDFLMKKQLGDYRIWMGYTYNTVEYQFNELADSKFPGNNDITHNLTLSSTYNSGNWKFSLGWNYRTGAPFTPIAGFNNTTGDITFGDINSLRLPDYHRMDASAQYHFPLSSKKSAKGLFGISLQNLYAREVPLSIFYRVDENPDTGLQEIERLEQLSLGIAPNFLVRFSF